MNVIYSKHPSVTLAFKASVPDYILDGLWRFVKREFYLPNFEVWVSSWSKELKQCLHTEWFNKLILFNYKDCCGDENEHQLHLLQAMLYQAIRQYPTRCSCIKLLDEFRTDWHQHRPHDVEEFPDSWDLIMLDLSFDQEQLSLSTLDLSILDGRVLQCFACSAFWLEMFDQNITNHYYMKLCQQEVKTASVIGNIPERAIWHWFQDKHN